MTQSIACNINVFLSHKDSPSYTEPPTSKHMPRATTLRWLFLLTKVSVPNLTYCHRCVTHNNKGKLPSPDTLLNKEKTPNNKKKLPH